MPEDPPFDENAQTLPGASDPVGSSLRPSNPSGSSPRISSPSAAVSGSIGPYRILERLGEGGMGQVYLAEQREPIRRKVALKIIKPGMDSREVLARFEAERQALALMDHPNIARVLDAGTTDESLPYFVMELVDGKPITEFCDEAKLPLSKRLELFVDVCHAIQHAHQKGIIHRDLKPSNILVTAGENKHPIAKVIDFGLAKALGPGLTEHTLHTAAGQLMGTPQYMSPEQAVFDSNDVDTRSDIYSLGVILYELLTGRTPLNLSELRQAGIESILRNIREEEALRPSNRVSSLAGEAISTISGVRGLSPNRIGQRLRGDLDWIVMKALEKDRSRRYETANAFALDIRRYLTEEPVSASPPSPAYRFSKFARRNKGLLTAGALIMAVLLVGIATTAWQAREAKREQVRAETARAEAEKLVTFMLSDLRSKLSKVGQLELMETVETAVRNYYESSAADDHNLTVQLQRATAFHALSQTFESQGRIAESLETAHQSLAVWQKLFEREPGETYYRQSVARLHYWLSILYKQHGDLESSNASLENGLDLLEEVPAPSLEDVGIYTLSSLRIRKSVRIVSHAGQTDEAKELALQALKPLLRASKANPDSTSLKKRLASAVYAISTTGADPSALHKEFGDPGTYSDILDSILEENPSDYDQKYNLLRSLLREDIIHNLEAVEKGLALARELTAHDPSNRDWQSLAASMEYSVGWDFYHASCFAQAEPYLLASANRLQPFVEAGTATHGDHESYARTLSFMALNWNSQGKKQEAEGFGARSIAEYEKVISKEPGNADLLAGSAYALLRLAGTREDDQVRLATLEQAFQQAQTAWEISPTIRDVPGSRYYVAKALAHAHRTLGNYERALEIIDIVLETEGKSKNADALGIRGQIERDRGDIESALATFRQEAALYREYIERFESDKGVGWSDIAVYLAELAHPVHLVLNLDENLDQETITWAAEHLHYIENHLDRIHPDYNDFHKVVAATAKLIDGLSNAAFRLGDLDHSTELANQALRFRLNWLPRLAGREHRASLLHNSANLAMSQERRHRDYKRSGSALTRETTNTILKTWDGLDSPIIPFKEYDAANRLYSLACRARVRTALSSGDLTEALHWLRKGEEQLDVSWEAARAAGYQAFALVTSLQDLAETCCTELGDFESSLALWEKGITWSKLLTSRTKGELDAASLNQLALSHQQLAGRLRANAPHRGKAVPHFQSAVEFRTNLLEKGDASQLPQLAFALTDLATLQGALDQFDDAVASANLLLDLGEKAAPEVRAAWSSNVRGRFAQTAETLGDIHSKVGRLEEAEVAYHRSLELWNQPDTTAYGDVPGTAVASRVKLRLAALYGETGRSGNPLRLQWFGEIIESLEPLARNGTLPNALRPIYESARKNHERLAP